MAFVVTQRFSGTSKSRSRSMLRTGRLLAARWRGWHIPTAQERTDRYLSRMPIAVLAPAPVQPAPGSSGDHR